MDILYKADCFRTKAISVYPMKNIYEILKYFYIGCIRKSRSEMRIFMENVALKPTILLVDDSAENRKQIEDSLCNAYNIIEACSGEEAISILNRNITKIEMVLLKLYDTKINGLEVLAIMNQHLWLDFIPVIVICRNSDEENIVQAYDMGAVAYINKPYDRMIVRQRIKNLLSLYQKQRDMRKMLEQQVYENEKNNNVMITILAHIVEFRNGESGMHVMHIQTITKLLLQRLQKKPNNYNLTDNDVLLIATASALHDVGKISVDDKILNKPGRLNPEEFEVIKKHSAIGADMLKDMEIYNNNNKLIKTAYEICRWHHERYDGNGYPDGLVGEEIPISAQVVSIADVYDALTSERCYKKAYSHEKAMEMIENGECGEFNPLLLECLEDIHEQLIIELNREHVDSPEIDMSLLSKVADEIVEKQMGKEHKEDNKKSYSKRKDLVKMKAEFYSSTVKEIQFDYDAVHDIVKLSPYASEVLGLPEEIVRPNIKNQDYLGKVNIAKIISEIRNKTSAVNPRLDMNVEVEKEGIISTYKLQMMSLWSDEDKSRYLGVVGRIISVE